jgi:hypothetical protein
MDYDPGGPAFFSYREHSAGLLYRGERILVRKVSRILSLVVTAEDLLFNEQIYVFKVRDPGGWPPHFLLAGILLSQLQYVYYNLEYGNVGKLAYPQFTQTHVLELLVPPLLPADPLVHRVAIVTESLQTEVGKYHQLIQSGHSTGPVIERIQSLEAELNTLVGGLYGFSPEEMVSVTARAAALGYAALPK